MKQCNKLLTIRNKLRFHSGNKFIIYKKKLHMENGKFRDKTNGNYVHASCSFFSTGDLYHFRINKILYKGFF